MKLAGKVLGWAALVAAGILLERAAWGVFDSAAVPDGTSLKVLRVIPEGSQVPSPGRQIVVTFDRPVKALGDLSVPSGQSPVTVSPAVNCQWHWLDPRSLACELDQKYALAPATEYTVTVAPAVKAQDGTVLESAYSWTFTTERPAVTQYSFKTWRSPGMPVIRLVFNVPVSQESVQTSLHFGTQKSVTAAADAGEAGRSWLVSPTQELAANATIPLKVLPGLRSTAGPLPGVEKRTVVSFDTFPAFRFLGVRCMTGARTSLIATTAPADKQPACNPFGPVSLVFSSPVIALEVKNHLVLNPDLLNGRTDYDPWTSIYPRSYLGSPHKRGTEYTVELPEYLRAFQSYNIASLQGLRDEFGRTLSGPATLAFRTDHRPPRLKVTHPVAVLEKNAPTSMPLYVTNLTDLDIHYRRITSTGGAAGLFFNQPMDRVWDTAYATPARIRELLEGRSGVITGSFDPHPSTVTVNGYRYFDDADEPGVPRGSSDRDFFAEVTPYQVHTKIGAYNTLVWVTSLDKGLPVVKARVRVFRNSYQNLTGNEPVLAEGVTDRDGLAVLPGRKLLERDYRASPDQRDPLMVRVDLGGDMALLPLDTTFLVDLYRASRGTLWSGSDYGNQQSHIHTWGTTAQGVYKLGDTVQYKVYVRDQNNLSLAPVEDKSGYELTIVDPTGKVVQTESNLTLSPFGAFAGSFHVPLAGAVGWYEFNLKGPSHPGTLNPMRLLVADFTPAPFQVSNTLNGQLFQPGDPVEVTTRAALHAGGPYASASSRVTARLFPKALEITAPVANGFQFDSVEPPGHCSWQRESDVQMVHQSDATTSDNGEFTTQFNLPDTPMLSGRLEVESAVRDERGKYVANRSSAEFRGRDRFVGLHNEHWTLEEGKPATVQFLVVDKNGKVVQGEPVSVGVEGQIVKAARVKGAGSAYLTSYEPEWQPDGSCTGTSGAAAQNCTFTPSHPGLYSILASVKDTHGKVHQSELCTWVTGKGRVLWEEPADMSLSVIPEKPTYKVGEHARYLVKNPFPGAKALVTIERYGVIKHWVQVLSGDTPVIDFKIEPDFVPGFYLSVVVTSPRVAATPTLNEEGVDLGRPTYRIGYLRVNVADPYKTLDVRVKSDRASYEPRDTVKVQLAANGVHEPVEFAVAVLDESVFDLIKDGKSYFDPYRGLYRLDELDLSNYSLLTRLIGLQKFAKKGANSGGDGGAGFDMRTVNKYVAYWNPSVIADKRGRATVSFQLPDNLTGWRVFAIAVTPADRVGLGEYKFKSSKLTELRPVLPNQLTSGDRFTAGFSVLNRSDQARKVDVSLEAHGPIGSGNASTHQVLTLGPFKRETVWLPLSTVGDGIIRFTATAGDRLDKDALGQTLPVHKRVSLDVAASYGTTLASEVDEALQFPVGMMAGIGESSVTFSPSVIGNVDGAMRYIRDYPYLCWEQRLTKALMAANYTQLQAYLGSGVAWPEAKTLPQTFLNDASTFQAPDGGMGFWTSDNSRVSPYLSAATALGFNRLRSAGFAVPEDVEKRLDGYLQALLRANTAPSFYSEGMVSSVRAVALQALAERQKVTLSDLQRYEKYIPQMDLFGLAAYLDAAVKTQGADNLARRIAGEILSHANQSGGQFHFSERWDDGYAQMLSTPLRSNCAILNAFLDYGETPRGAALVGDVPFKLVRVITQTRGSRDHWENTQENVFCTSALVRYSALYEKDTPALKVTATLDGAALGSATFSALKDPPAVVSRPNGSSDAGRKATMHIEREGTGRLYYSTRLSYSLTDEAAKETNAGMELHREYSVQRNGNWQLLTAPMRVRRGELVRVDLYLSLPAPRHFVVVDDPVPGGLEPVNRDLATGSTVDADATEFQAAGGSFWFKFSDWSEYGIQLWSFYHRELLHEAARFYADYLPAGNYHLSYGAQAMAEGEFSAPATKAEEMYDPDVYGKGLPGHLSVGHE
ncbi:MAG: Ig-like domain-containing protein [Proteobacteria bacterium]|nr:Ig-like domain-containing protein [Pseudomonadota bacterium]